MRYKILVVSLCGFGCYLLFRLNIFLIPHCSDNAIEYISIVRCRKNQIWYTLTPITSLFIQIFCLTSQWLFFCLIFKFGNFYAHIESVKQESVNSYTRNYNLFNTFLQDTYRKNFVLYV